MIMATFSAARSKTLVVYYSYTNNVHRIISELSSRIEVEVVRVVPAEKGLDYAANNYAIGSALISAIRNKPNTPDSYPAIDPVNVNLDEYDTVIIGAPLWWSNMAAPMQTFLFQHGAEMAGKNIGLIVSSASSGISGVEGDAKRLIPDGKFLTPSLWIRSSQTSNAATLISDWLKTIDYESLAGIEHVASDHATDKDIFPAENTASAESNTGEVHLSLLKSSGNTMITRFHFSPGSRNFWHYHPNAEQTLLVMDGEGFYQEEGKEKRVIRKGDVIVSKANVRHWNGATSEKPLICITVTEHSFDGHVVQLRAVTDEEYGFFTVLKKGSGMCAKLPMSADGIIRLSKVEVDPAYLDEYMKFATEVGEISLRTEPGVLTMYAVREKENPCNITILETYASQESYRSHIASAHFQKYKQGTLHMVKNLQLLDQTELNPSNKVVNYIK